MTAKRFYAFIWLVIISSIFCLLSTSFAQQQSLFKQIPDEIKKYNFYKRFEWFQAPRIFPFDSISIHTYHHELNQESSYRDQMLMKISQSPLLSLPAWQHLGPSSVYDGNFFSGRVRGVAIHPSNPDIAYIGAASGGLWKTIDGGATWQNLSDDFACNTFGAIAIDPNNPDVIYAGTGEVMASGVYNIYDGRGLFKSIDGGNSWQHITHGFGEITQLGCLTVNPHNTNIVFAALGGGYAHAVNIIKNKGIWRSDDSGLTWTRTLVLIDSFNTSGGAYDVIVHPTNPNRAYAALGGSGTRGFFISDDNGLSWRRSSTGLPYRIERMQIALAPTAPSTIYAVLYSTYYTPYRTKLFKSINDGNSWNEIAIGYEFGAGGSDQGSYDLCIAVDPTDANHVFVGNIRLSVATDGENFSRCSTDYQMHVDYHKIVFAPSNPNFIYIGNDGGVFRSGDRGNNWQQKNQGLSTLQLYMMASHPTNSDTVIAGSQDNGGFYTKNSGASYWILNRGGDISGVFYDHLNPNTAYSISFWQYLYKSANGGISFPTYLGSNFDRNLEGFFLIHPTKPNWLYAAKDKRVIRSENGGTSWTPISAELTKWPFYSMDQSHANPNNMILASWGINQDKPQVMVSTNEGYNWSEVTANIPGEQRFISKVVAHPTEENTLFVVRSGYGSGKIYRSTDIGITWENITNNLPDIPHSDLFIDPQNTNHYYVANDFGAYASFSAGRYWIRLGNGMPFVVATDLDYFNYGGNRLLRVATYGRGVYELDLNQIVISEFTVAGNTSYYSNSHPIASAAISLGDYQALTNPNGSFLFAAVTEANYTLKASLDGNLGSAISALDASKILRYVVGTDTLSPYQKIAADVSGNGSISALDASYILRHVVGIITEFPVGDDWTFIPTNFYLNHSNWNNAPDSIHYTPLNSDQFDQNFFGIIYGDVSGNWSVSQGELASIAKKYSGQAEVYWGKILSLSASQNIVPIHAKIEGELFSAEFKINFNPDDVQIKQVMIADGAGNYLAEHKIERNRLVIAIAATQPIQLLPDLVQLKFERLNRDQQTLPAIEIESVELNGGLIQVNISEPRLNRAPLVPDHFELYQSYPNPFNPMTTINYSLARDSHVKLTIYNTLGQVVAVLEDGFKSKGWHSVKWDTQHYSSGLYIYRLEADGFRASKKMFLQK